MEWKIKFRKLKKTNRKKLYMKQLLEGKTKLYWQRVKRKVKKRKQQKGRKFENFLAVKGSA